MPGAKGTCHTTIHRPSSSQPKSDTALSWDPISWKWIIKLSEPRYGRSGPRDKKALTTHLQEHTKAGSITLSGVFGQFPDAKVKRGRNRKRGSGQ